MDTPERNQISAPTALSKFEDSPVFNYINSLSPIQPVRSTHIAQSFNSLTFASPPSVFTSPHVSSHKESRFLKRHQNPDSSKPEFSSENDGKVCSSDGVMDSTKLRNPLSNVEPGVSTEKGSLEAPSVHPKSAVELSKTLKYDCGSPNINPISCGVETKSSQGLPDASTALVKKASEKASSGGDVHRQETSQSEQEREGTTYEWESLISDSPDLLIFNSPDNTEAFKELMQKSLDRGRRFCTSLVSQCALDDMNAVQSTLLVDSDGSVQHYGTDGPSSQPGESSEAQMKNDLDSTCLKQCMVSNPNDKLDNEPISNLHRGMRRRCLDFEMAGAHRKNLNGSLHCKSSLLAQFDEKIALSEQSVAIKPSGDSLRRILPGIGLHLNALAAASKDYKTLKCETLSSGRQIINLSGSVASLDSSTANQEPLPKGLASTTADRDQDAAEDGVQTMEDASGVSAYLLTEEFNQNSPKKKRRRLEQATETEGSCKRCNCKKSKCLKLYCECFAAGVYCIEPCSCQDCFNKPIHEDTVLATRKQIESRNPLAFAPKVIRSSDAIPEIGDESSKTPASARHKRGCNCKKSSCLKKYCECYQGGVGCSINCRCEGCKNSFGRKDGCSLLGTEGEQEEEESELLDKSVVDKALQKTEIQHNEDQKSTSAVPMTPLQLYRPLIQLPFSSKSKPPRCTFPAIGSTSGSFSSQKFGRPSIIRSQPKFEKQSQTQTGAEDEMPEILRENSSPNGGVKTGSPNSKRVSPPHCNFGSSSPGSGRRSGRKLILQSIPSFPSLTPQH